MKRSLVFLLFLFTVCCSWSSAQGSPRYSSVRTIVKAVNEKDADLYVMNFAEDVKVYLYESDFELRIEGREAMRKNREAHFKRYPNVRNEIQHLVEIDNKVVMHDKVWLDPSVKEGSNIVEVFTFQEGKIVRVDVIQQKDLFQN
ncbi:MAG: nuclear transport factor 2 family protein [Saonia sp.]